MHLSPRRGRSGASRCTLRSLADRRHRFAENLQAHVELVLRDTQGWAKADARLTATQLLQFYAMTGNELTVDEKRKLSGSQLLQLYAMGQELSKVEEQRLTSTQRLQLFAMR